MNGVQDGRSSGLTAPNGPSQSALIRTALASGSVDLMRVHTVSVHGTGTPLGDPIEVGALGQGVSGPLARPLTMLSNKSCFGHTEGAAGVPQCRSLFLLEGNRPTSQNSMLKTSVL